MPAPEVIHHYTIRTVIGEGDIAIVYRAINTLDGSEVALKVLRAVLRHCDAVAVFGEEVRQELIQDGVCADRVFVLPNTADTDLYCPDPSVQPDVDLVFVGNFIPRKQVDRLLRALHIVHETRPQTNLLLVGDGDLRGELETLAQSLGIAHAVEFHGHSDRVVDQLRRGRVFVLLSNAEGLPMSMIEAMCTGLPVVVTNVGANASVIHDGDNGYLVPSPADPSLVADRILRLLSDPARYQQMRHGALRVRETHGYERAAQIWDEILNSLR
jgi:glycosyltransferase involved in cell wall biosynthesis